MRRILALGFAGGSCCCSFSGGDFEDARRFEEECFFVVALVVVGKAPRMAASKKSASLRLLRNMCMGGDCLLVVVMCRCGIRKGRGPVSVVHNSVTKILCCRRDVVVVLWLIEVPALNMCRK